MAELQRRLRTAGYPTGDDATSLLGDGTVAALRRFQADHGCEPDGICDAHVWELLEEAGFPPGERLLCLKSPMVRGHDVAELQLRLGGLGFDAGKVDAIFGPATQLALREFQRNAGLICDDVCGPETWAALRRLEGRAGRRVVADVREQERLRQIRDGLVDLRLAVGGTPDSTDLVAALALRAEDLGETALVLTGTWEDQAAQANAERADLVLGLALVAEPITRASFFEVSGYSSFGGQRLARLLVESLDESGRCAGPAAARGTRLPLLRETRPPAVVLEIGPAETVRAHLDDVTAAVVAAVEAWTGHDT